MFIICFDNMSYPPQLNSKQSHNRPLRGTRTAPNELCMRESCQLFVSMQPLMLEYDSRSVLWGPLVAWLLQG